MYLEESLQESVFLLAPLCGRLHLYHFLAIWVRLAFGCSCSIIARGISGADNLAHLNFQLPSELLQSFLQRPL